MTEHRPDRTPEAHARWLRAARPDTGADHGWAASADGDRALRAVHDRVATDRTGEPVPLPSQARRRWSAAGRVGLLGAAAAALVVGTVQAGGDGTHHARATTSGPARPRPNQSQPPANGPVPAETELVAYTDCGQMLADLRAHTAAHVTAYGLPGDQYQYDYKGLDVAAGLPAAAPSTDLGNSDHSGTNDQESDVDEPDIVKTDGTRIVTVTGSTLRVVDASTREITGSLDLGLYAGADSAQLLVSGDRALVILGDYGYQYAVPFGLGGAAPGSEAAYVLVDLSGAPRVIGTLQSAGTPVDARLVGSTARLVVDSTPRFAFPELRGRHTSAERIAANRAVVEHARLSAWLPSYTTTGADGSRTQNVPCSAAAHPVSYTGTSMTTIYTVDLDAGLGDLAPTTLAADGSVVYATTSSLYVASEPTAKRTQLDRFDITAPGRPTYLGSATVPGALHDSYALSDYDGDLRVVTTTGREHPVSTLYELDDATLKVIGRVGGLGRGEDVYAVRFLGALGYVVTYRQVDPLYVLDLADPAKPRTVGELRAAGYSSYLHPLDDGRLLGVGAVVGPDQEPTALKLSLLDVANPSAPRTLATVVRRQEWTPDLDPHAFLYWAAQHLAVVPVPDDGDTPGGMAVVRVGASSLQLVGIVHNPGTLDAGDGTIERALVIGDSLWTLSDSGLSARGLDDLHRQVWLPFE